MHESDEVAVIGLGRLGSAIALRLLEGGWNLAVYNRSPAATRELEAAGARVAATPAAAAAGARIVVSCLTDGVALRQSAEGDRGFAGAMAAGSIHVSMGTVTPADARSLSLLHQQRQVNYVNVPVQGRPDMAAAGRLVAWAAGPRAVYDEVAKMLSHLAARQYWLGEDPGLSAVAKLALNYLMYANIALFAEAMGIVENSGLPREAFAEGLLETAFDAPLFRMIVQSFQVEGHPAAGSDVALTVKDLSQLQEHVAPLSLHLPLLAAVRGQYGDALDAGWGALSQAVVIQGVTG